MELGATVCTPREPACPACPLRGACRAARPRHRGRAARGHAAARSRGRHRGRRPHRARTAGCCWSARRGPADGTDVGGPPDLARVARRSPTCARELRERHGLEVVPGPLAVRARHAITFRRSAWRATAPASHAPPRVTPSATAGRAPHESRRCPFVDDAEDRGRPALAPAPPGLQAEGIAREELLLVPRSLAPGAFVPGPGSTTSRPDARPIPRPPGPRVRRRARRVARP